MSEARDAVAAVERIEAARITGALGRYTGDLALAEDLAQEALAEALVAWPRDGVPRNPAGWLLTVGRRRAIDAFRRRSALDERYAALARGQGRTGAEVPGAAPIPRQPTSCCTTPTRSAMTSWRWRSSPATPCCPPRHASR